MSGTELVNESVLRGVAKLLGLPDAAALAEVKPSGLWRLTQRELLDVAKTLGLQKVSRLKKEALLARVWEALAERGVGGIEREGVSVTTTESVGEISTMATIATPVPSTSAPRRASRPGEAVQARGAGAETPGEAPEGSPGAPSPQDTRESRPGAAHKFDVGEGAEPDLAALRAESESSIPWGYGRDRVTAMPVDPDRLFVYWEVTDDAIAKARAALGAGGDSAYLCARLYDISGRIFDGTNAHSYSDHGMDRAQRQWFFHVGKPTSEALVEVGLKSHEGYFVKVARSGRVLFPPRAPRSDGRAEWLTVRVSTGEVEGHAHGPAPSHRGQHLPSATHAGPWETGFHGGSFGEGGYAPEGSADLRRYLWGGRLFGGESPFYTLSQWEEVGTMQIDAEITRSWSWHGDLETESWSAGPFSYPVAMPNSIEEKYSGPARVFRSGPRTHVVWGPWEVVIKGIGARAEREVLGHWEIYRSWSVVGWPAGPGTADGSQAGLGPIGASDRRLGGSELRLGGASERFRIGASELRLGGSSERAFMGASERLFKGASERRWGGSSELRMMGASEKRWGGASELRMMGASERRLGGASEQRFLGASERFQGGQGGSEGRLAQNGSYPAPVSASAPEPASAPAPASPPAPAPEPVMVVLKPEGVYPAIIVRAPANTASE
jgi:hypothetical protein